MVVWVKEKRADGDTLTSAWIERGPEGPVVQATRQDLVVAAPTGLLALSESPLLTVKTCCEEFSNEGGGGMCCKERMETKQTLSVPVAVPLAGGKQRRLGLPSLPSGGGCKEGVADAMMSVEFTSVVGPFVYLTEVTSNRLCGMIGSFAAAMIEPHMARVDLSRRGLPSLQDKDPTSASLENAARGNLTAALGTGNCKVDPDEKPTYQGTRHEYDKSGLLQTIHVYTMSAPYGYCGAHKLPIDVIDPQDIVPLPRELVPLARLPGWVLPYLAAHTIAGVSPIPDGVDLGSWLASFRSPLAKAKHKPGP
jgi:hypothetical protein